MFRIFWALTLVFLFSGQALALGPQDVGRITPEELMASLERGDDVLILDLRSSGAYNASDSRIKGDMRIAPDELKEKMYLLPMGRQIVTYCT